ncbi:MAG: tryptophan--tRNA ligase [Nanoarchaeota archaeon]|nr:tryptophan--tRNA ligase [Nanoarchaeota archaeon]MBU1445122.1 tryptophan--tRNA ligase [Nanoarchaeota archaeon]MBU2406663.1 tryptophan--tRNA ligase [Nanoarchaeota archaeon]MBU2420092.1 tryptophan--tRNA ligase [Nanoarchaeota archaeon]MBU2475549.1 tryptophan--tRNA ligase [Nanoarchaeota archaeon]
MKESKKELKEKQAIKEKLEKEYKAKIKEYALTNVSSLIYDSDLIKKDILIAHHKFDEFINALKQKKKPAIISGVNPDGPLHLGHAVIFKELIELQKQGADVFIPISNDESYITKKSNSLFEAREIALKDVIPSLIALGFEPQKTFIHIDSDYTDIYNLAIYLSTKLTLNRVKGVFGFNELSTPGSFFYLGSVQEAHILLPQIKEFGGPRITTVPVGFDQHPQILLSRFIAKKANMVPPGELIFNFLPSLKDPEGKMSKSKPETAIFLTDSPEEAERKLKRAYTGGLKSGADQKILGGVPEICPIFLIQKYHFLSLKETKDLEKKCKSGKILCGDCKKQCIEFTKKFLKEHHEKREKAKKQIDKFLIKEKIDIKNL